MVGLLRLLECSQESFSCTSKREGHFPPPQGVLAASSAPPDLTAALQSAQSLGKLCLQVLLLGILEASQDPVPSRGCTGVLELAVPAVFGIKHPLPLCSSQCGG